MSPKQIGPVAQTWYRWKALRLPWRKRFLVGFDLQGNTYWEFRLTRGAEDSAERWRRIVQYPRSTHYSQVKVSPQWHQWLRYTRREVPTLEEQRGDVVRQDRMKRLAAEADARWEAKPKVMEDGLPPDAAAPRALPERGADSPTEARVVDAAKPTKSRRAKELPKENDPWAKAKPQGPSESWQPAAWSPTATKK